MVERPPTLPSLAILLGGIALYVVVWEVLDPPPTWTRCPMPSSSELAELSARRDDFLPLAVPPIAAYTIVLAAYAWRWAGARRARQGHEHRPGRLARGVAVVLGGLWSLLIAHAFTGDAVGGSIFWGFFLAAATAVVSASLAFAVLLGAFHSPVRSRSRDVIDSVWVGLSWSVLLTAVPLFLVVVAVVGKDTTFVC
jgi:hypothetical protein